jgi:hypothetical protein
VFSGHGLKLGSDDIGPGQEIVDLAVWVVIDDPGEHVGQVAEWLDVVQLARLCRTPNYAERLFRSWRYEALCQPFPLTTGL